MSDAIIREHSVTVRLSAEERALLEALAARFQLDKSATIRKAVQLALAEPGRLPQAGQFVAAQSESVTFPVRLSERGTHE
ncbi:MAG: hypothetical protein H6672_08510 [Anaerolineaceae bacterium]|nr:hypothetical protein [Anaerolineaceae bacterium]